MNSALKSIAYECGKKIMNCCESISYSLKIDASPLTLADQASHDFLDRSLKDIKNIPVLSEENIIPYTARKNWDEFWLIDPLDGTKEFINGHDEFCINIALIQNKEPVLGLIYAPKLDEFYYAEKGRGFEYKGPDRSFIKAEGPIIAVSRFHHSQKTEHFLKLHDFTKTYSVGAALKFGRMALGEIDVYPRLEGSKEWDIAAGHIILKEAQCFIVDLTTNTEPIYNKQSLENNYFIAYGPTIDLSSLRHKDIL
jgi:3'(2'), 5'-bisphosphate nucleotidase